MWACTRPGSRTSPRQSMTVFRSDRPTVRPSDLFFTAAILPRSIHTSASRIRRSGSIVTTRAPVRTSVRTGAGGGGGGPPRGRRAPAGGGGVVAPLASPRAPPRAGGGGGGGGGGGAHAYVVTRGRALVVSWGRSKYAATSSARSSSSYVPVRMRSGLPGSTKR